MPHSPFTTGRTKPHSRVKAAARDRAAMNPDVAWAASVWKQMLAACHPFQADAACDPSLRISLLVGRGGGKTTAKRVRAIRKMITIPRARIAYVATSRPEAERLNWEPLKQLLDQLGEMDHFEFAEQKMRCMCRRTGATYQFFGADDKREINKLRGQPFDEFQVDEAASHDPVLLEEMIDRAVGPRLGERDGCIVLGGTPGHVLRGLFYDVTRDGSEQHRSYRQRDAPEFRGWIGWSSHAWDMVEVMALPHAERQYPALAKNWAAALVEKQRKGWSDDNPIWLREYRGKWAADNTTTMYAYRAHDDDGKPLNRWDPLGWTAADWASWGAMEFPAQLQKGLQALKTAVAALPAELGDWLFGYGQDLGSRDPYALNIFAFSPSDEHRRLFHVFCFDRRKMYARLIAELLIGEEAVAQALRGEVYTEVGGLFGITGWPPAIVAGLEALGGTLVDELQKVYGIKVKSAEKKGKYGAIEVFNGDLVDGRMSILANSPLEAQLATLQWKPDEYGQPKEDKAARNDHADAATYIRTEIGNMFSGVAAKPTQKSAEEGKQRTPRSLAEKPRPSRDWGDRPYRSKSVGEFDSLLRNDNFSGLE